MCRDTLMQPMSKAQAVFVSFLFALTAGGVRSIRAQNAAPAAATALDPSLCELHDAATPSPEKKTQKRARGHLDAAHDAYEKGDFVTTLTELQAAYALEPSVDILYNMAQSCRAAGLVVQSLSLYEAVLAHNPTPEQQEACNAKLRELRPKLAAAGDAQAVTDLAAKRYAEAIAGLQQALKLSAEPLYLFHLAEAQRLSGNTADAVASYQRLLTEAPSHAKAAEARQQLGLIKAQQADQEAKDHYDKGEYLQAVLGWDSAYKESSRPIFLFRKADAMRQTGQRKEAAAEYERFLKVCSVAEQPELREEAARWAKELRRPVQVPGAPKPLYTRWWFWTSIVGGAVVAAGVATGVALGTRTNSPFADIPSQNVRPVTP